MLKRKIYDELIAWKNNSAGETAMMYEIFELHDEKDRVPGTRFFIAV